MLLDDTDLMSELPQDIYDPSSLIPGVATGTYVFFSIFLNNELILLSYCELNRRTLYIGIFLP